MCFKIYDIGKVESKRCGKQYQWEYVYRGCVPQNKELVMKVLCRGSSVRDSAAVSDESPSTVLTLIRTEAATMVLKARKHHYHKV
ncbi:MAG: hypothetical protein ICV84_01575 [Flavisolibacter sp.]|nr:hypothetical protein [Flavisolibacter sp.]